MKKLLSLTLMVSMLAFNAFMLVEGGVANAAEVTNSTTVAGASTSVDFDVTVEVTPELSITCDLDTATMVNAIPGLTGGSAVTSTDCNVKTNNYAGYQLKVKADNTNALELLTSSSVYFTDYATATPAAWITDPTLAQFGFNVTGSDIESAFSAGYYRGLAGVTDILVAHKDVATTYTGVSTTFNWKAEVGSQHSQETGIYKADITVTAFSN